MRSAILRVGRGAVANIVPQGALAISQLLMVPVLASHWGVEALGLWLILLAIGQYVLVSDIGLGRSATVRMTMYLARGESRQAVALFQNSTMLVGVACLVCLIVVIGTALSIPRQWLQSPTAIQDQSWRGAIFILGCYNIIILAATLMSGPLQSTGRYVLETVLNGILMLMDSLVVIVLVALLDGGPALAALGMLVSRTVGTIGLVVYVVNTTDWLKIGVDQVTKAGISDAFHAARSVMLVPLSVITLLHGATIGIGVGAGPAQVAQYTTVRTLSRLSVQIVGMFVRPLFPEFSRAMATHRAGAIRGIALSTLAICILGAIGCVVVLLSVGVKVTSFWTAGHIVPSRELVALIAITTAFALVWTWLSGLLVAGGHQARMTNKVLAIAVALCVVLPFISMKWGLLTGAAAVACAELLVLMVTLGSCKEYFFVGIGKKGKS